MSKTTVLRTRIDSGRKARVEKILSRLGLTASQAVNLLFAQIEEKKAIPFQISLPDSGDILPPIETVARVWNQLDDDDFTRLLKR